MGFVSCFSHGWTRIMGFGEEDCRGKVPFFVSHHDVLTVDTDLGVVIVRFFTVKLFLSLLSL